MALSVFAGADRRRCRCYASGHRGGCRGSRGCGVSAAIAIAGLTPRITRSVRHAVVGLFLREWRQVALKLCGVAALGRRPQAQPAPEDANDLKVHTVKRVSLSV